MNHRAIDLVHLARQTGGDDELEQELLKLFADQCQRQVAIIRDAADRMMKADAAHTLKGAARAVGAWHVADAAEIVETLLNETPVEKDLPGCVRSLSAAASEACDVITRLQAA